MTAAVVAGLLVTRGSAVWIYDSFASHAYHGKDFTPRAAIPRPTSMVSWGSVSSCRPDRDSEGTAAPSPAPLCRLTTVLSMDAHFEKAPSVCREELR